MGCHGTPLFSYCIYRIHIKACNVTIFALFRKRSPFTVNKTPRKYPCICYYGNYSTCTNIFLEPPFSKSWIRYCYIQVWCTCRLLSKLPYKHSYSLSLFIIKQVVVLALTVIDLDDPPNKPDDQIDDITLILQLDDSRSSSRAIYSGRSGYASIDLSYRVICAENTNASNCGTLCVERSEGDQVCLDQNPRTNCTECIPTMGCCKSLFRLN